MKVNFVNAAISVAYGMAVERCLTFAGTQLFSNRGMIILGIGGINGVLFYLLHRRVSSDASTPVSCLNNFAVAIARIIGLLMLSIASVVWVSNLGGPVSGPGGVSELTTYMLIGTIPFLLVIAASASAISVICARD